MDGFGASITDSSAAVLYRLDPRARATRRCATCSARSGDGCRSCASRWARRTSSPAPHYTYDDVPAGADRLRLRHFSIAHDRTQILPLLRQALALNPQLKVIGTPWSPPAWMKTNDSLDRRPADRRPAHLRGLRAATSSSSSRPTRRAGVPVYARHACRTSRRTATRTATRARTCRSPRRRSSIEALGPALRGARACDTKILGYDHNWSEHPNDIANTPPGEDPETEYPYRPARQPGAARWLAGTAYHCYAGDPSRQTDAARRVPGQGHLVHRVLRLARPDRPAGAGLLATR